MIKIYGKSLEDYKKNDKDGAFGYALDLGIMIVVGFAVALPVCLFFGMIADLISK